MKYFDNAIAILSISAPVIMGAIRFNKINKKYYPFIFLLFISLVNEILQLIFGLRRYVAPAYCRSNIYILVEYIFYLWFFKNILLGIKPYRFKILIVIGVGIWLYENIYLGMLARGYDYYYQVSYSLALALLAIEAINEVLLKEKGSLLRNGLFLIAAGMAIFFTFDIFVEIELHFATVDKKTFFKAIFAIQQWINCFVNLVFALAILWIPTIKNFTKPSF